MSADERYALWKYFIMPFMSGVVGWGTNVLALKMTFHPIEYTGLNWFRIKDQPWGFFGWQGIVPTKAAKMASTTVQLMTQKLFKLEDVFKRLDPEKFYEAAEVGTCVLDVRIREYIIFLVHTTNCHFSVP